MKCSRVYGYYTQGTKLPLNQIWLSKISIPEHILHLNWNCVEVSLQSLEPLLEQKHGLFCMLGTIKEATDSGIKYDTFFTYNQSAF